MSSFSFSIQPVTESDIPNLAKIAGNAFQTDRHTQMKGLGKKPYNHEEGMRGALAHWLTRTRKCAVVKAVDDNTGENLGWVCWAFYGYEQKGTFSVVKNTDVDDGSANQSESVGRRAEPSLHTETEDKSSGQDSIARLEAMTDADMEQWQEKLMPEGSKCMIICSIVVDPTYHSRGVGSALIQWGTARADDDGVYCWVHASEAGHKAFAKQGFKEVGRLEVNLDDFAPAPCAEEGRDGQWGRYIFRYMKRVPQSQEV